MEAGLDGALHPSRRLLADGGVRRSLQSFADIKPLYLVVCGFFVLPFLSITCEVICNSYTVLPFVDGWVSVLPPDKWGDLLFLPHGEHRIGLIVLLSVWDNTWFQGKGYLLEMVELILLAVEAGGFLLLVRRDRSLPAALRFVFCVLIPCIAFSAIQFTNIVWPFQVGFVAAYSLGMTGILITSLGPATRPLWIVLISLALAGVGSLGLGGGVLAFPCIVVAAFFRKLGGPAVTLAVLACTYVLFAYPVPHLASENSPIPSLFQWVEFTLTFLGAPVAAVITNVYLGWPALPLRTIVVVASLGGIGMLVVYTVSGIRLLQTFRAQRLTRPGADMDLISFQSHLALTLIMTFVVVSAIVVGYSRSYLGIGDAYSSRYLTPTLIGWTAGVIYLSRAAASRITCVLLAFVISVCFGLLAISQFDRLLQSRVHSERMRGAEIAVATDVLRDSDLSAIYPDPAAIKPLIKALAFQGRSVFATPYGQAMGRLLPEVIQIGSCRASDVSVSQAADAGNAHIVTGRLSKRSGLETYIVITNADGRVTGVGLPLRRDWLLGPLTRRRTSFFEAYVAAQDQQNNAYRGHIFRVDGDKICRLSWE